MLADKNRRSLLFGIPGIALQAIPFVMIPFLDEETPHLDVWALGAVGMWVLGTLLLIVGLCYYAEAKGHRGAWGVLGILGLPGLIALACFPDRNTPERLAGQDVALVQEIRVVDGRRPVSAFVSFYSGLVGLFLSLCMGVGLILGIVSVVAGHMARGVIRREPEMWTGAGYALTGLVMGYIATGVNLAIIGIFILVAVLD